MLVYGARRVGKTVLLEQIKGSFQGQSVLMLNGDTKESGDALGTNSETKLSDLVRNYDVIFVDEAQRIPNVALALKIIIDKFPEKIIIVTGSSSLELAKGARDNLTGRNQTFTLWPLSTNELVLVNEPYKMPSILPSQLVYGGYPYIYSLSTDLEKQKYLLGIIDDYLFRDVLSLERLERPDNLRRLATLLAFQIGREVSQNELAKNLLMSVKTVGRYLDLLERSFVIFRIDAHSTNMRKEVSKSKKYYFYDLGIRNALINQFQPLSDRTDVGELWENFLFAERMKKHNYAGRSVLMRFWRNYAGSEIDLVEIEGTKISAFEFKWGKDTARTPASFKEEYGVVADIVNQDNYMKFLG